MSQSIIDEVTFFFHSFLMGIAITFVYDGFIILRRLIRHNMFLVSLEDMVFWIACAIGVFYMLYEENNGILRWFAVLGAALGMIAYKKSVSGLIVNIVSTAIERIVHIFFCVVRFVLKPVRFLVGKVCRFIRFFTGKGKKAGKYLKNRLTGKLKLLKMVISKH